MNQEIQVLTKLQEMHECDRCGECCIRSNPIMMLGKDAAAIAKYLGIPGSRFQELYTKGRYKQFIVLKSEGPCPFLGGKGPGDYRCTIYEVRPEVCRRFPWLTAQTIMHTKLPQIGIGDKLCPTMFRTLEKVKRI